MASKVVFISAAGIEAVLDRRSMIDELRHAHVSARLSHTGYRALARGEGTGLRPTDEPNKAFFSGRPAQ